MNILSARLASVILLGLVIPTFTACHRKAYAELEQVDPIDRRSNLPMVGPIDRDLADIKQRGTLTVLAPYNSTTYFIYRGEALGYEYELLQSFAKNQGLNLKMVVVADPKSLFTILNSGEGDIAANRLVPTPENEPDVSFTRALYRTEPVLVQQEESPAKAGKGTEKVLAPGPADQTPEVDIQARLITKPSQLTGKTVTLPEQSPYTRTRVELADENSGEIHVVEMGALQDEALAQKVARGEVEFTVMQKNLADLKEAEFKNLKVRPIISKSHSVAWAVRKNAPELMQALNDWIEKKQNGSLFDKLYQKYFIDRRNYLERVESGFLTSTTGKLCAYDDLLKQNASQISWDWRLLASQAFQESRFKAEAHSWAGAAGPLQLMPATTQQYRAEKFPPTAHHGQGAGKIFKRAL